MEKYKNNEIGEKRNAVKSRAGTDWYNKSSKKIHIKTVKKCKTRENYIKSRGS